MNWRRIGIGIAIAIVAIIIALFVAVRLINVNQFRPQIEAALEKQLQRPVTLGQMHLHIFPLSVKVDGITIGQPPGFPANPPFLSAKQVSASVGLGSILGGKPDIHELTVINPKIELIKNAAHGVWNFLTHASPPPAQANAPEKKPANQGPAANFQINKLKIVNGQLAVTDERTQSPRAVYNHIDITLTNFAPGKPFAIAGKVHFPGPGKELLSFNGTGGPLASGPGQVTPLNAHLSVQEVSLTNLNSSGQIQGLVNATLTATGSFENFEIQGEITAPKVQIQQIAFTNLHAESKLDNGVIRLSPVTAGIFGGEAKGAITVDTKAPHSLCSVKARLTGVDVNALLSAVGSVKDTLDGRLAAQGDLNFTLGASANFVSTLNGTLKFSVANGHLKKVNILGELARIGKFLNAAPLQSDSGTLLKRLAGTFDIHQGIANTNNLAAILAQGSLSAKGSLNLVNQKVDMHMVAVLPGNISKAVGGTSIGGFLTTALANNKGELVFPVIVTGSMAHPVFAPDLRQIAQMKMKHLLPTAENPGSILGAILGAATGKKSGQKKNAPNPLDSLFKALGKKH